jgi:putative tricarboxylic transport membrane protein
MNWTAAPRRADAAGLVVAVALLCLAALVWWDMASLSLSSTYGLGPQAMPVVVALGLVALAVANALLAFREPESAREALDPKPAILIGGGLAVLITLLTVGGGFIPGAAILFAATAAAFGRRAILADLAIGLAIAVATYVLFAKLLSLSLPIGPLERLI